MKKILKRSQLKMLVYSSISFCLLIAMLLTNTAQANTYYFSHVSKSKPDNLDEPTNWVDSISGSAKPNGIALFAAGHIWRLNTNATLNADLTTAGVFYIDAGGSLSLLSSKTITLGADFINNGTITVDGNSNATFDIPSGYTFQNNGTVDINKGQLNVTGTYVNGQSGTTSSGTGTITVTSGGQFINYGDYENSGTTTVNSGGTFTNTGTVSGSNAITLPILDISTNTSVPNGAIYSGIIISNGATLTALGNLTTATLTMSNGKLILGDTLNVSSTISGMSASNYITSDGSSSLNFTGTSTGSIYVDQTTPGTTNSFNSITLNTSGTITLGNRTQIDGLLTPTSGTLATGDSLTLTSTSSTSYAQIAPESTGTITGNITMQMGSSNTNAGWRPIALPLTGTIANLSGINRVYSGTTPANTINTYRWDATQDGNTGKNIGWTAASATDNQSNAFLIYANNNSGGLHDYSGTLSMTGTYTTGTQNFALKNYIDPADTGSSAKGWNFIPNPYASNLNITALLASGNFTPTYKAVHVYNYSNDQYQVYSKSGVAIVNYNNTDTVSGTIKNLSPYAGFWVKSGSDQTITLTNAERTTSTSNVATLLKKPYDLLRLDVFDANNKWDQCVIYLKEDATVGFDNEGDAYKLDGMNGAPALSTLIGQSRAAINALPTGFDTYTVPVSYKSATKGPARIAFNTNELGAEWTVELEDKLLGKTHSFNEGDYIFTHDASSDLRFVIHLKRNPSTGLNITPEVSSFRLFQDFNTVQIDAGFEGEPVQLEVYSINGQLVESITMERNGIQTVPSASLQHAGVYIIRAQVANEFQQIKVLR